MRYIVSIVTFKICLINSLWTLTNTLSFNLLSFITKRDTGLLSRISRIFPSSHPAGVGNVVCGRETAPLSAAERLPTLGGNWICSGQNKDLFLCPRRDGSARNVHLFLSALCLWFLSRQRRISHVTKCHCHANWLPPAPRQRPKEGGWSENGAS